MRVTLDGADARLVLEFDDADALDAFVGDWKAKEGFLVRLTERQKLWAPFTVVLQQGAVRHEIAGRVVQVFGGGEGGWATAFQAVGPEELDTVKPAGPAAAIGPAGDGDPAEPQEPGEMQAASPVFRIRGLNIPERMRLATKATRTERQILLRDNSPQVLMGLLANPRLEEKEVLALVKSSAASSGILQRIAKDRRWSANYEIRLALVRNPQTPTPLALRMLDTLRERDLRVLAKGSMVREAIRGAALRLVIKRGG